MSWRQALVIISCLMLWACSTLHNGTMPQETIQTWVVVKSGLRHHAGQEDRTITFEEAIDYRCYSPNDDLIWRNRMSGLEASQGGM